ncbi:MAG: exopolysaccharide Pel transporter PelG [Candidatus Riflebacteria bacterium]|nr:exopolysaccharide Pel transporter PelG [Candidatus Riflebacteria bacterium]
MAGIGFRLPDKVAGKSLLAGLKGYFYAAFLVAGPWLMSILTIFLISSACQLTSAETSTFRISVVYLYSLSLIFTGLYQMPLTRFISDEIFKKRVSSLIPAFLKMSKIVLLFSIFSGIALIGYIPMSTAFRLTFVAALSIINLIWLSNIFLTCLSDYQSISLIHLLGALAGFSGAWFFQGRFGLEGAFSGFVLGQAIMLLGIIIRIIHEIPFSSHYYDISIISVLRKYILFLWIGFTYNLGIWVDKMMFWMSPFGEKICGILFSFDLFDTAAFFSYVTVVPALSVLFYHVETSFHEAYRNFYGAINFRQSFTTIENCNRDLLTVLKKTLLKMFKVQFPITIFFIVFAPEIFEKIGYPEEMITPFRLACSGSFFQSFFLLTFLLLLYFDFPFDALVSSSVYLFCNIAVNSFVIGYSRSDLAGLSFLIAAVLAFVLSWYLLHKRISDLIYITYMKFPMPEEADIDERMIDADGRIGETIYIRTF